MLVSLSASRWNWEATLPIVNGVRHATGRRIYELPITLDNLL